ncbi:MAG: LUD domain-containing protein [Bacteroidales bacterium]|nr:LUD domain-containing protein [Bacteroidales bacterium]
MSSKDTILTALRASGVKPEPRPEMTFTPMMTDGDKTEAMKKAIEGAGGHWVELKEGESVDDVIARLFPDAKRIASNLKQVGCATYNPDTVDDPRTLNETDVAVVDGRFGVIENGSIWLPRATRHKALYFISEALVVILPKDRMVDTMHEAYKQPELADDFDFGCFIAGPSKTADIEQALVIGAHGARELTVLLV